MTITKYHLTAQVTTATYIRATLQANLKKLNLPKLVLPGNIWLSGNPVEVLNEHLSLLVGSYVPTKVIRVRNKDKPWFDDQCKHAFWPQAGGSSSVDP